MGKKNSAFHHQEDRLISVTAGGHSFDQRINMIVHEQLSIKRKKKKEGIVYKYMLRINFRIILLDIMPFLFLKVCLFGFYQKER